MDPNRIELVFLSDFNLSMPAQRAYGVVSMFGTRQFAEDLWKLFTVLKPDGKSVFLTAYKTWSDPITIYVGAGKGIHPSYIRWMEETMKYAYEQDKSPEALKFRVGDMIELLKQDSENLNGAFAIVPEVTDFINKGPCDFQKHISPLAQVTPQEAIFTFPDFDLRLESPIPEPGSDTKPVEDPYQTRIPIALHEIKTEFQTPVNVGLFHEATKHIFETDTRIRTEKENMVHVLHKAKISVARQESMKRSIETLLMHYDLTKTRDFLMFHQIMFNTWDTTIGGTDEEFWKKIEARLGQ